MTLKLDHILTEPLEVDIGGKIYLVEDPGIMLTAKVVNLTREILDGNESKLSEYLDSVRAMVPTIPDEFFNALSIKQLGTLINAIGRHFLKTEGEGGKPAGPLPVSELRKSRT